MKQQKLAIEKVKIKNWPTSSVFFVGETLLFSTFHRKRDRMR